ncbi:MAG: ABC transporter ATP-binding protein, partial [bacterium]
MTEKGVSLKVKNLSKKWGDVEVLSRVNFEIESGGFLTLLGPSGCGKSTILRLVAGLDEVSDGQVEIDGRDITFLSPAHRNIGMVFQNYALFPHMTIEENIAYGLKIRKVAKDEKNKIIRHITELMGLGQLLQRKPAQLSGGQQQRVALARVLVSQRPIVLMDEPLSNLDAKLRVEIRSEIKSLNKQLGITIVYVTHDQSEALSMSDKVVLLQGGKVVQTGTPKDLYENPKNIFSASFIGTPSTNLLTGKNINFSEQLNLESNISIDDCIFAVRPENISLNPSKTDFSIHTNIEQIEYE